MLSNFFCKAKIIYSPLSFTHFCVWAFCFCSFSYEYLHLVFVFLKIEQ